MELKYKLYSLLAFVAVLFWNLLIDFDVLLTSALNIAVTIIVAVVLGVFLQYEVLIVCNIKKVKYFNFLIFQTICLIIFVAINYLLQKNIIQDFGMTGTKLFLMTIFGIYLFTMLRPMGFKECYDSCVNPKS